MTGPAVGDNWHAQRQKCITKVNPLTGERAMINQTNTGWWWVMLVVFMCRVFTHMRVLCAVYLLTRQMNHRRWYRSLLLCSCNIFQAQIDLVYWNCLKGNTEVNLVRQGGAHHLMGFPWACRYCLEVNMHTRTYPNQPLSHMQCVYIPLNHYHTCSVCTNPN